MDNNETIKSLNDILQYLNDSRNGYAENQAQVADSRLKDLFTKLCQRRKEMIDEIKAEIKELGGEEVDHGTVAGKLHQWYQAIKNAITEGDPLSISRQIKFGENFLIESYKDVLQEDLPPNIKQLLTRQLNDIEEAVKTVDTAPVH